MYLRIENLIEKKLIGKSIKMSMANNKILQLWQSFMPKRKSIKNTIGTAFYSMQVYDELINFKDFNPHILFTQYAVIEVSDFSCVPDEMETYTLEGGLYAVFLHKGLASDFPKTMQYIFETWIPNSEYVLDKREHFEKLGDMYKNNHPDSEEEVWIPIRLK